MTAGRLVPAPHVPPSLGYLDTYEQGHMTPIVRRNPHPDDELPPMSPRAAAVIEAARGVAWLTHGNTSKAIYAVRRDAFAILRGCLEEYDREPDEPMAPTAPGELGIPRRVTPSRVLRPRCTASVGA